MTGRLKQFARLIQYNFKVIFGNKFGYFLFTAFVFFAVVAGITLFNESSMDETEVYYILIFPGLLLVFYPTVFGLQNDKDARMLEVLFGIPNYRFRVWAFRVVLTFVLVFVFMYIFSWLSVLALVQIPIMEMTYQIMYPLLFMGSLGFLFSTWIKSGNGAAVVLVVIGLFFWILSEPLYESKWNVFLNPFDMPRNSSLTIWLSIIKKNRIMMAVGSLIALLGSLINLQKREKFI